ncbi:MAG: hypothetical protein KIT46_00895 [Anaerolineales bacterium]|nr:hypothetical protein [Anaerolineales bacterium]MCW5854580.1 hypothetical protein [Anaerolineales bacterium]
MPPRQRRSIRLPEYDYSQPGAYFVTLCVEGKEHRLGAVIGGGMQYSGLGMIASQAWGWLPERFPLVSIPVFCIMPNHAHAIIVVSNSRRGALQSAPTKTDPSKSGPTSDSVRPKPLGRIVGAYKTHTTVQINAAENTAGLRFWQRNYYERIIRNEREYEAVYAYIQANPINWEQDEYR